VGVAGGTGGESIEGTAAGGTGRGRSSRMRIKEVQE
jgi:hypothetical protein